MTVRKPIKKDKKSPLTFLFVMVVLAVIFLVASYFLANLFPSSYVMTVNPRNGGNGSSLGHIKTPEAVRGVYMTACVAGRSDLRSKFVDGLKGTSINSIIIDIKDYSGTVSIPTKDESLKTDPKKGCHTPDIGDFIQTLHEKGFYVIGRISVFQDPYYTKIYPEYAVKRASDGGVWRDRKGLSFVDVSARPYWQYIAKIGKEAYYLGFDELNFDYIRFPSDGDMKDISYPWSQSMEKKEALRHFFGFLKKEFRNTGVVLSADLFGMTTTNTDDLNIGQYLEFALPYFDYVSPMVYPSHYPATWNGYANPADKPYEVVKYSMEKAFQRASTTPQKLRPWLQDFNLGATYTAEMVKAQMKAVYDVGLTSWMLWDPANTYTAAALNYSK